MHNVNLHPESWQKIDIVDWRLIDFPHLQSLSIGSKESHFTVRVVKHWAKEQLVWAWNATINRYLSQDSQLSLIWSSFISAELLGNNAAAEHGGNQITILEVTLGQCFRKVVRSGQVRKKDNGEIVEALVPYCSGRTRLHLTTSSSALAQLRWQAKGHPLVGII